MRLANPEIRIEPTNRCNANCAMCPREKMTRRQGCMDISVYHHIIRQAAELGATKLSLENYGEPLLNPHLFAFAEFAKELGCETLTITNGSLMNSSAAWKALEVFDVIRVSLNAMTIETYRKVQPKLDFNTVTWNIDHLLWANHVNGRHKARIIMSFLMLDENAGEVQRFIDTYKARADGLAVWKPHNWIDGRQYRPVSGPSKTCGRPEAGPVQIQWDGKVVPCCFDYDSRMILGDLTRQSLVDVVCGPEYERLRQAHRKGDFSEYPLCAACDQLHKDDSVLVYTNIAGLAVGMTHTGLFKL